MASFANDFLDRYLGQKTIDPETTRTLILAEIAANLEAMLEGDSELVETQENSSAEVTEAELAGIMYRLQGFQSADRAYASRIVAREMLKVLKIERK